MAQADASIYNLLGRGVKSPEEYQDEAQARQANALQLRSAQSAFDQQQRGIQEDQQFRNALASGADENMLMRISPAKAMAIQKQKQDMAGAVINQDHTKAQTQDLSIKNQRAKLDQHMQLLGMVQTPEDLIKWASIGAEAGVPAMTAEKVRAFAANPPKDPAQMADLIRKIKMGGMTLAQQNDDFWKANGFGLQVRQQTEVERNNSTQNAISRGNLAVSQGNLGLSRQRLNREVEQGGKAPSGYRYKPDGSMEAIPGGPADVKAQAVAQQKASGGSDVDVALATLRDAYDRLESGGGITSTKNGALGNLAASTSASSLGQAAGRALGTSNQSARNDIAMSRPALLAAMMKATGMSAKQMDSNAELKLWLATATDPQLDVESNRRALSNIERKYLGGSSSAASGATRPPASGGVPDDIAAILKKHGGK